VAACDLTWFENRPLLGRRVVVTRARAQAGELVERLGALGAATVEVPAIEIVDPDDRGAALAAAVERLADYDWLVLTSPNGARRLLDALDRAGRDARALGGVRLATIGPGTAAALAEARLVPDLVPPRYVAESLLDSFPDPPASGGPRGRVLLVRAAVARDVLPAGLAARGWDVDVVDAYRSEPVPLSDAQAKALADAEIVTFTSSSTVTNLVAAAEGRPLPPVVAAIGPVTAATARDHGLSVTVEAEVHTIDGLVDALLAWAAEHPAPGA
jgi:uroporphyrinogen III methyltransferase/synthase